MIRKLLLGIVALGVLFAGLVLAFNWWEYINNLSDKDYSAIERRMDAVYKGMEVADVDKARHCYYYRDGEGDRHILTCGITMAGYVDAKDANDLSTIAEKFAKHLRPFNDSDEIWNAPTSSGGNPYKSGVLSAKDSKLIMGCLAYVKGRSVVSELAPGIPKRDITDRAALIIRCGGTSRKAYFEMY